MHALTHSALSANQQQEHAQLDAATCNPYK